MIKPLITSFFIQPKIINSRYNYNSNPREINIKKNIQTSNNQLLKVYSIPDYNIYNKYVKNIDVNSCLYEDLYSRLEYLDSIEEEKQYNENILNLEKIYGKEHNEILSNLSKDSIKELEFLRIMYDKPNNLSNIQKINIRKSFMILIKKDSDILNKKAYTKFWIRVLEYYNCL